MATKTLRTCDKGHKYYKSSDCPTCPICERESNIKNNFLATLGAPARRALEREGISTEEKLSKWKKSDILKLHGLGPSTMPKLEKALAESGLSFKKE